MINSECLFEMFGNVEWMPNRTAKLKDQIISSAKLNDQIFNNITCEWNVMWK